MSELYYYQNYTVAKFLFEIKLSNIHVVHELCGQGLIGRIGGKNRQHEAGRGSADRRCVQ